MGRSYRRGGLVAVVFFVKWWPGVAAAFFFFNSGLLAAEKIPVLNSTIEEYVKRVLTFSDRAALLHNNY
jgi:hypothetical protein